MSAADTAAILRAARSLIALPERWTTHASARDAQGFDVPAAHASAVCWCAAGAIARVAGGYGGGFLDAVAALHQQLSESIYEFNDRSVHADVLSLFDATIQGQEALSHGNA